MREFRVDDVPVASDIDEETVGLAVMLSSGWACAGAGLGVLGTGLLRRKVTEFSIATNPEIQQWR